MPERGIRARGKRLRAVALRRRGLAGLQRWRRRGLTGLQRWRRRRGLGWIEIVLGAFAVEVLLRAIAISFTFFLGASGSLEGVLGASCAFAFVLGASCAFAFVLGASCAFAFVLRSAVPGTVAPRGSGALALVLAAFAAVAVACARPAILHGPEPAGFFGSGAAFVPGLQAGASFESAGSDSRLLR